MRESMVIGTAQEMPRHNEGTRNELSEAKRVSGRISGTIRTSRTLGFGAYCAWMIVVFYSSCLYVAPGDYRSDLYVNYLVSVAVYGCGMLVIATALRAKARIWLSKPGVLLVAGGLLCMGTALLIGTQWAGNESDAVLVASAVLTGLGSAPLFLGWVHAFSGIAPRQVLAEVCLSWFVASAVGLMTLFVPLTIAGSVAIALPIASCFAACLCAYEGIDEDGIIPEALDKRSKTLLARAVALALLFGVIASLAASLCDSPFAQTGPLYGVALLAVVAIMTVGYFSLAMLGAKRLIGMVYRTTMLLMSVGCMSLSVAAQGSVWSNVLVFAGHVSFMVLLVVICVDAGAYHGLSSVVVAGIGYGALCIGEAVGTAAGWTFGNAVVSFEQLSLPVFGFALSAVIVIAHLYLFTELNLSDLRIGRLTDLDEAKLQVQEAKREGERKNMASDYASDAPDLGIPDKANASNGDGGTSLDSSREPLQAFAKRYGLTPREREVLDLLMRGRTVLRIQEELVISRGTANTHVHHIYRKCGVSGRQALYDLVEAEREDNK